MGEKIAGKLSAFLIERAFAVSEAVRSAFILKTGFPQERVICCPNWVDTERFRPDQNDRDGLRREYGIPPDMLLIGYVGRLAPEKRVDLLVRAYAELQGKAARPTKMVLIGRGWKEQEIHTSVREMHLENHVMLTGWCTDVAPWYRAIDVLILPSLVEGFPLVVLEAMACGTPCIVHDSAGAREWVDDERNGFVDNLVEPSDLTRRLQSYAALDQITVERLEAEARRKAVEGHDQRRRLGDLLLGLGAVRAAERLRGEGLAGEERSYVETNPR
jgi:glycosyltransferase involved in cell wall biosynthesis